MHASDADEDNVDLILIEDDGPAEAHAHQRPDRPWRVLIVDDDVDVHVVTKVALNNTEFQDRRLSYLHAYSAAEAIATMRNVPDIALVLLTVIVECADAGLGVVRHIRDELHNDLVRIVLRTGQAGQSPTLEQERALLLDHDITAFWNKADLTTRRLVSTVISSLRTYAALSASSRAQRACAERIAHMQQVRTAMQAHLPLLVLDRHGRILEVTEALCRLAALPATALLGRLASSLATALRTSLSAPGLLEAIRARVAADDVWTGTLGLRGRAGDPLRSAWTVQAMRGPDGQVAGYVVLGPVGACSV